MLADNPKVALAAAVHAVAFGVFYSAMPTISVLQIDASIVHLDRSAESIEATKAHQKLEATTKAIRKGLPKNRTNCGAG
jgi:hypothetical protein